MSDNNNAAGLPEPMVPSANRRILFSGLAATLAALLIVGVLLVWETVQDIDRNLRRDYLQQARMTAKSLDMKDVDALSGTEADLGKEAYQRLKRQLSAVGSSHDKCRFVYLLGRRPDGKAFFFLDNELSEPGSEDYSPPGQIYDETTSGLLNVFSSGTEFVSGPEKDRWGVWVSALIPLRNPRNRQVIAVFGMDIDASDWRREVLTTAAWPAGMIALLIILLALSYALIFSRRRMLDYQTALRQSHESLTRTAEENEKQRRLMESLLDAIPAPVFFKDKNGNYLGCNPAFEKITGRMEADIIGKKPHEIWPDKFSATYRDKDMELLATGGKQRYEYKYSGADGSERDVIFYKSTFIDASGEIDGIVGVMLDITERKNTETELLRLRQAMDQVCDMIVITDIEGDIQYVNPAFEKITGYDRMDAIGKNPRILKSGLQDQAFYENLWATITAGRTWQGRMVNKRRDGTFYTEEATISPVFENDGRIVNFAAVKRDITEHLRLSAQLIQAQKMESVGRLAGGVAHDFNNMLNVIIGHAELAIESADPGDPSRDDLQEILGAARRSAEITRQLLAFARKQTIAPEVLDLNAALEGMLKMLRRLAGEDIDLVWRPGPDLWPIYMDPVQIDQLLANLLVNARDAIAGTGWVVIETGNESPDEAFCADHAGLIPGDYVRLSISDNGRGMDQAVLDRLFEPFVTTKGVGEGSGLGLATVYGIVKQNNGFIYAKSEPLKGTTFWIFLPRHTGDALRPRSSGPMETSNSSEKTILIVEDEVSVLKLTRRILERQGYRILTATATAEALKLAEEHKGPIDLLITDVIMPDMNGRELYERLRHLHSGLRVLYMSGYTADIIGQRGALDADVHFIPKPFSNQALAEKVQETLGE